MVDVINSMEVYDKEIRARLHAKSKSAPKSFWSDTESDENSFSEVTDVEVTGRFPKENIPEFENTLDRKNESEDESSDEDDREIRLTSEDFQKNFGSSIRMRLKANYSKPIDLYSEARKIEREKIEKRLKWEQRKWSDTFGKRAYSA